MSNTQDTLLCTYSKPVLNMTKADIQPAHMWTHSRGTWKVQSQSLDQKVSELSLSFLPVDHISEAKLDQVCFFVSKSQLYFVIFSTTTDYQGMGYS